MDWMRTVEPQMTEKCFVSNIATFNYETNITLANDEANVRKVSVFFFMNHWHRKEGGIVPLEI